MTYREYRPTWLQEKIMVDEWGRPPSLADVPMTLMTRKNAYNKRKLTEEQVDDIYEKWILKQEELHNAEEKN
tara:strand:- start:214 stop:429 length:216 start_codon:yes stop_codon:yes gene_type:complete